MAIRKREWITPAGRTVSAWQVDYVDQAGKRRSRQFKLKKEAEGWLSITVVAVSQGTHTADRGSITVAAAADLWISKAEAEGRERSTLKSYRELAKLHVIPFIGAIRLPRLTAPMVEKFRDDLLRSRSKAMTNKALTALSSILGEAIRRGLLTVNVASAVRVNRPSRERDLVSVPERAELRRLIGSCKGWELPFVITAISTGIRSSELRGLRWQDLNLTQGIHSVRQRADDWGAIGKPKSAAGTRDIPLPPEAVIILSAFRDGKSKPANGLVFSSNAGTPLRHNNVIRRMFIPLQLRAGVFAAYTDVKGAQRYGESGECLLTGRYGLHALRHAAASNWIDAGVDLKRLQSWLAHSSVQMTIDRYGHLMNDKSKDAAIAFAASRRLLAA